MLCSLFLQVLIFLKRTLSKGEHGLREIFSQQVVCCVWGRKALWLLHQNSPASGLLQRWQGWCETSECTSHPRGQLSSISVMTAVTTKPPPFTGHTDGCAGLRQSESVLGAKCLHWRELGADATAESCPSHAVCDGTLSLRKDCHRKPFPAPDQL